jgi:hypothetical protein
VISLLLAVLQALLARSQQKAASETQASVVFSRMPQKKLNKQKNRTYVARQVAPAAIAVVDPPKGRVPNLFRV